MRAFAFTSVLLALGTLSNVASAQDERPDEPGAARVVEEPGMGQLESLRARSGPVEKIPSFRLELAYGWASLLKDPDVGQGQGGGLFFGWGINHRLGVELSVFFSHNPYQGSLSSYGGFMAGNITVGPMIQLTRPGSRFMITFDLGMGAYFIPVFFLQDSVWSYGLYGGFTLGYRLARWFGFGMKLRYHLFHIGGPELRDPKALQSVGVIDRLEMPVYLAFYF